LKQRLDRLDATICNVFAYQILRVDYGTGMPAPIPEDYSTEPFDTNQLAEGMGDVAKLEFGSCHKFINYVSTAGGARPCQLAGEFLES